jgi:pro-sigmaK processing inhibitor BofA
VSFEVLIVYFALLLLIALGGKYLFSPMQLLIKFMFKGGIGFILLLGFNLLSRFTGYYLPINFYTALYCGFLGLPGLISLCFLKTWL